MSATTPIPFYCASDPALGELFYFRSEADARAFQAARGGWVIESSPGTIWRVAIKD